MKKTERKKLNFDLYDNDVYCHYGTENGPLLNDEVASTLQEKANNHKIKDKLLIEFKVNEESPIDKTEFLYAYHNTYSSKIKEKKHEVVRCIYTGIILLIIGILMLALDVSIEDKLPYFWFEFFNVFAWVFCWGAIEVLTIELAQIEMEINKIKKLTKADIVFTYKKPRITEQKEETARKTTRTKKDSEKSTDQK
jgi:hypothetical protein